MSGTNEGIAIYSDSTFEEKRKLELPPSLFCASTSHNVNIQGSKINNSIGELLPSDSQSYLGSRTFSIQGNVEVNDIRDVENERSRIFSLLYGRQLYFFRDAEDDRYYICFLQGNINIAFNQGYNIGRVFSISFNLICFDGFSYSKKENVIILTKDTPTPIAYNGSIPTFPTIAIRAEYPPTFSFNITTKSFPLIEISNFKVCLTQDISNISSIKQLLYKKGFLYISYKDNLSDETICGQITSTSLMSPPYLKRDSENITKINLSFNGTPVIRNDPAIKIILSYRELNY